jgi:hypothetical protein
MLEKTPDQLLDEGAALLDRDGWVKGVLIHADGRCALGAIYSAQAATVRDALSFMVVRHPQVDAAVDALAGFVGRESAKQCQDTRYRVAHWNNAWDRCKEDVTAAMRATAAQLRAEREAADALARAARAPADADQVTA